MSCNVYESPHELTSPHFAKAFARGCNGTILRNYIGGDWAGFGSPVFWDAIKSCIESGHTFYYGDKAYFRRGEYYRITKNGLFHTGNEPSDGSRWRELRIKIRRWRSRKNIVLCPQSESFFNRLGMTKNGWIDDCMRILSKNTDRKIIIHEKRDRIPLLELLRNSYAVISHSSNSCLEAVINGVPAFCTAERNHVENLTLKDLSKIETPWYPENRYEVACSLADNQWTLKEIAQGLAWSKLNDKI